jgi:hypothetical protein
MPNRLALCGLAVVVAVSLAGCGGEDSPKSDPTPSAKPSPTGPPGLDATEPPRPTKQSESPESALEYGRYFAQLVQYGVETRNSRVIDAEAFDQAGCTNCRTIAALISDLKRTGYWQLSDPIKLGRLRAVPMEGGIRVKGSFVYPEVKNVKANGDVGRTGPAATYRYYVDLQWDEAKNTWQVLDFVYQRKG